MSPVAEEVVEEEVETRFASPAMPPMRKLPSPTAVTVMSAPARQLAMRVELCPAKPPTYAPSAETVTLASTKHVL